MKLTKLTNIGKLTAQKLEKMGIHTAEEFLARDPYEVFEELRLKFDPNMCRCALSAIVGAHLDVPWPEIHKSSAKEFEKRFPNHKWKNKC